MTRKRSLTVAMIRRVRSELGISADLLISTSKSRAVANSRRGKTKANPKPSGMKKRAIA
jgi:hypothetical protein